MQSSTVPQRKIGQDNVSALGFGLMGMSAFYTHGDDPAEAEKKHLEVMTRAADLGNTFWDTSDIYGPFTNEELIGKWFKMTGRRKEIFLATKFAIFLDPETKSMKVRGDKEYVKSCIEGSLNPFLAALPTTTKNLAKIGRFFFQRSFGLCKKSFQVRIFFFW